MKLASALLVLSLGVTIADDLDCMTEGVTNKATCDDWCGSTGAFLSSISAGSGSGVKGLTGWECDCDADVITNSTSDKDCETQFDFKDDAQDCTSQGVSDKATCDTYCGEDINGTYTEYYSGDVKNGIDCICGDVTSYEKHCISEYSGSAASTIKVAGLVAGLATYAMAALF